MFIESTCSLLSFFHLILLYSVKKRVFIYNLMYIILNAVNFAFHQSLETTFPFFSLLFQVWRRSCSQTFLAIKPHLCPAIRFKQSVGLCRLDILYIVKENKKYYVLGIHPITTNPFDIKLFMLIYSFIIALDSTIGINRLYLVTTLTK